jgi:hypothetical protein
MRAPYIAVLLSVGIVAIAKLSAIAAPPACGPVYDLRSLGGYTAWGTKHHGCGRYCVAGGCIISHGYRQFAPVLFPATQTGPLGASWYSAAVTIPSASTDSFHAAPIETDTDHTPVPSAVIMPMHR